MLMEEMINELLKIFVYIVIPGLAGITFFALAKFVKQIMPLRALVASEEAYKAAFWGFLIFGIYLALRPVQVLAGPHPWPLIISSIREFLLISIFGPASFIAMVTLCFGPEKISKFWIRVLFVLAFGMAVVFCLANVRAIGGSKEIVKLGMMTAYDGLWYEASGHNVEKWMRILFVIRLLNPGILLLVAASAVLFHAATYPEDKRNLYDNMPKKLYILSAAVYVYAASLTIGSFFFGFKRVPDQWGVYHLGSLIAGLLETISLSMPVRSDVQVSEHEE